MKKALIAFLFWPLCAYCQNGDTANSISLSLFGGMPSSTFSNALQGYCYGGEIAYHISMIRNTALWAQSLNVQDVGLAMSYTGMQGVSLVHMPGTNNLTGSIYTVTGSLGMAVFDKSSVVNLIISPEAGLAYVSRNSQQGNYLDGGRLNFLAGLSAKIMIDRFDVAIEASHLSSGGYVQPNSGINALKVSLGICQPISQATSHYFGYAHDEWNDNFLSIGFGAGKRGLVNRGYFYDAKGQGFWLSPEQEMILGPSRLYQIGWYGSYNARITPILSLKANIDGVWYSHPYIGSDDHLNFFRTWQSKNSSYDPLSVGLSAGPAVWLGRLVIGIDYGRYVHFRSPLGVKQYWEFRPQYYVAKWLAADMTFSYHGAESAYVNLGLSLNALVFNRK